LSRKYPHASFHQHPHGVAVRLERQSFAFQALLAVYFLLAHIYHSKKSNCCFAVKTVNCVDIRILIPSICDICDICIVLLHIPLGIATF